GWWTKNEERKPKEAKSQPHGAQSDPTRAHAHQANHSRPNCWQRFAGVMPLFHFAAHGRACSTAPGGRAGTAAPPRIWAATWTTGPLKEAHECSTTAKRAVRNWS